VHPVPFRSAPPTLAIPPIDSYNAYANLEPNRMEIRIDGADAMAHGETRTFDFPRNGRTAQGFLIRHQGAFHAYLNQCCHWPVPLDMGDNDFYYAPADRIMCKTHGAVYQPDTGLCDYGPCAGAKLDAYLVTVHADHVIVTVPD
jgi:nitrite reductase/ring-hydroxylating ferredoxin subunit